MLKLILRIIPVLLILTIVLAPSCDLANPFVTTSTTTTTATTTVTSLAQQSSGSALPGISQVVAEVRPAVVSIDVVIVEYDFFGHPYRASGAASGWIIDSGGYIVTNNHVVDGATSISVTLQDGRVFQASNVQGDATSDLAVIKIDATGLPTLSLGDSSAASVGDWVVAMGNSMGMGISATAGVVSALNVSLEDENGNTQNGLIQTDAAINPGNSGGPLVNMSGQVIGIDSSKIAEVGVEGMGYAISIDSAVPVIQNLMKSI